jgi:hypothetical protein
MYARPFILAALVASCATLGACSSDSVLGLRLDSGTGTGSDTLNNAHIRLANATATPLDLASNGVIFAGNAALDFGQSSSCTPTNAFRPDLAVRIAGTLRTLPGLANAYQSGVNYTVIAYPGSLGTALFATIADVFAPIAGQSALRVFNGGATGTSYDVYVTDIGAPLGTAAPQFSNVTGGTFSNFGNASSDTPRQVRITATGSKVVLFDVGATALIAGQSVTLVVASPLAGTTPLRVFTVSSC